MTYDAFNSMVFMEMIIPLVLLAIFGGLIVCEIVDMSSKIVKRVIVPIILIALLLTAGNDLYVGLSDNRDRNLFNESFLIEDIDYVYYDDTWMFPIKVDGSILSNEVTDILWLRH